MADAIEENAEQLVEIEAENTGKPRGLTLSEEIPPMVRPDPLLRGRGADARGQGDGRVHDRLHVFDPARADRRDRLGHALELPDDDGGVEVRARRSRRATRWCSSRRTPPRRAPSTWPSCSPRSCPPGCSTSSAATATPAPHVVGHPIPQMVSITGSIAGRKAVARSAADTLKRTHLELGGKAPVIVFDDADLVERGRGHRRGRATSTPDRTAPRRRGCSAGARVQDDIAAALVEQAGTVRLSKDEEPDSEDFLHPADQQRHSARQGQRDGRAGARPRQGAGGRRARHRNGYFY